MSEQLEKGLHVRLQVRLQELKQEHGKGQRALADLDAQRAGMKETLLRISGAIQVLEEELAREVRRAFDDLGLGEAGKISGEER